MSNSICTSCASLSEMSSVCFRVKAEGCLLVIVPCGWLLMETHWLQPHWVQHDALSVTFKRPESF